MDSQLKPIQSTLVQNMLNTYAVLLALYYYSIIYKFEVKVTCHLIMLKHVISLTG